MGVLIRGNCRLLRGGRVRSGARCYRITVNYHNRLSSLGMFGGRDEAYLHSLLFQLSCGALLRTENHKTENKPYSQLLTVSLACLRAEFKTAVPAIHCLKIIADSLKKSPT